MQQAEQSVSIDVDWARGLCENLIDRMPQNLSNFAFRIDRDLYWDLAPSEKIAQKGAKPTPGLGRIRDDLEFLVGMLSSGEGTSAAPALMLMHVVPIFYLWSELTHLQIEKRAFLSTTILDPHPVENIRIVYDAIGMIFDHIVRDLKIKVVHVQPEQRNYFVVIDEFDLSKDTPEIAIRDIADDLQHLAQLSHDRTLATLSHQLRYVAAILDMICTVVRA